MAFTPDLRITVDINNACDTFAFFDSTPVYNAISAPQGYDPTGVNSFDPNDIDLLTGVHITIRKPDGTYSFIQITSADYDLTRLTTEGKNLIQRTITSADLGMSGVLDDGIYQFTYKVCSSIDSDGCFQVSSYIVQDCNTGCCLDKKLAALSLCKDCTKTEICNLYNIYLQRDAAKILASCGDYEGANALLDMLMDYCNLKKCDSCN